MSLYLLLDITPYFSFSYLLFVPSFDLPVSLCIQTLMETLPSYFDGSVNLAFNLSITHCGFFLLHSFPRLRISTHHLFLCFLLSLVVCVRWCVSLFLHLSVCDRMKSKAQDMCFKGAKAAKEKKELEKTKKRRQASDRKSEQDRLAIWGLVGRVAHVSAAIVIL